MMKTYHANASRDGRFWLVHIPEIGQYTQGRNLAEVEPMARDLIALWLEIPVDTFHVELHVELPKDVRHHLELAAKYAADSAHAQGEAARERRIAARELKAKGLTVRDIGAALGISYQRAQQLVSA
jgi:predicted RNase H-like HicB family nuclease